MSRLIDIDDERFWDVLFDEACIEGKQAERIETELEKIVAFDTEKVVEQLEEYANGKICNMHRNCPYKDNDNIACENCGALGAIDIVKKGGVE